MPLLHLHSRRRGILLTLLGSVALGCGPASAPPALPKSSEKSEQTPVDLPEAREEVVAFRCGARRLTYEVVGGRALYQGDIVLPVDVSSPERSVKGEVGRIGQAVSAAPIGRLWPGKRIPYVIAPELKQPERVTEAIAHWEEKTEIRFVPRTTEANYVRFEPTLMGLCMSKLGMAGGMQSITLGDSCEKGSVIHEIGHAVGLEHEHSRVDRDQHIDILWENVTSAHQFHIGGDPMGPYDTGSVMHYGSMTFSKNGKPTMLRKDGSPIERSRELTAHDISGVATMYGARPCHEVQGAILQKWEQLGGEAGVLGRPVSPEQSTTNGRGRYSHFENGSIFWTPEHGAIAVLDHVRSYWSQRGWETGPLGFPLADRSTSPSGKGWNAEFEGGLVYVHDADFTPTYLLKGDIAARYRELGEDAGLLGPPVSEEHPTASGAGVFTDFQQASVYWSRETGARVVRGAIRSKWLELGGPSGALGFPVSDEQGTPEGVRSDFQGGSIWIENGQGKVELKQ